MEVGTREEGRRLEGGTREEERILEGLEKREGYRRERKGKRT